jgi:HK97 family phage major capsid protein
VIYTGTGSINPYRQPGMARQIQIVGNEWRGVSSDGIVASYGAELTETTDNAPTLAQPTANVEKAQAWIPFSIEVGEDFGTLQGELAKLLQKGKDKLEATKFTTGAGHGSQEPEGILTGATGTVAGGSATYAVADLYRLEEALDPEFQPGASFLAKRAQYNRIRQFDDGGGADLWMQLPAGLAHGGNTEHGLLGYPTYESSAMSSSVANGQTIMVFGDFDNFAVVDRIGMSLELIPHVMGASGRPIGQRGVYAHWRNTSKVLTPNAFKKQVQTA